VSAYAHLSVQARRLRVVVARDTVAMGALSILGVLLVAYTWNRWGNVDNDTGYDTLAGWRVAHGQLPYVDYTYYYGPLAPFALGLFSLVGGDGMVPALVFGLLVACGILTATYALARMRLGPLGAFLATALVLPVAFSSNQFSYVDPHTHSATLAVLLSLLFLLAMNRFSDTQSQRWLVAAGAWGGLALLTRPEFAAAVLLGAAVWLWARRRSGIALRREVLVFAAPALAIPAAVYGAFLTAVSPHRLLFENLYPRDFYHAAASTMLKARAPLTLSSFVQLGAKLLVYAFVMGGAVLLVRSVERRPRLHVPALVVCGIGSVLVVVASVADPEALRHGLKFAYGWIPAGAALAAALLLRKAWKARDRDGSSHLELGTTVVLAVVAAATYAAFYVHAFFPQMAVYALPLAAVFLASLHLGRLATSRGAALLGVAWLTFLAAAGIGLTLKDARIESATVHGPGGTIAAKPEQAAVYRQALGWIERSTAPHAQILVAPQLTWLYALSERRNPLPELSLLPGALAEPGSEQAAIRRLEQARVPLILTERRTFEGYGHTYFGGSFDRDLAAWIRSHYRHAALLGSSGPAEDAVDIWLRRST
jgi:dolichyl-phosphate-mannose-protein mannosyltransferase